MRQRPNKALFDVAEESSRGARLNEDKDTPPEAEEPTTLDKPIDLIPKSAIPYRPRVGAPLDLLVDLSVGVVLGRSESSTANTTLQDWAA